jgi:hypothetical protein
VGKGELVEKKGEISGKRKRRINERGLMGKERSTGL